MWPSRESFAKFRTFNPDKGTFIIYYICVIVYKEKKDKILEKERRISKKKKEDKKKNKSDLVKHEEIDSDSDTIHSHSELSHEDHNYSATDGLLFLNNPNANTADYCM